ncbi:hypothetical protein FACS1894196_2080 [Clostridia bacterium]|nr:hypothetical protein FACS1894196_2080 [Clostridia bacterium]
MPAPLSNDLRKRIISARESGDTFEKIAREKQVSISAIVRILTLYRDTGSYEPRPLRNGRKPRLDAATLQKIQEKIQKQPEIGLQELIDEFSLPVSVSALCRTVNNKLGLTRKKDGSRGREATGGSSAAGKMGS